MRPEEVVRGLWWVVDQHGQPVYSRVLGIPEFTSLRFRTREEACRWIDRHTPREES